MTKKLEAYNYAKQVAKLEEIVARLESGGVELDEALKLHTEGKELAEEITVYLEQVGSDIRVQKTTE
jgi:exodeoxyribonuclease VII small subunit